ncbi:MAG: hypothetical protein IPG25_07510 [Proteobacteria bacterium]|nr:hypothetical protein [Pseudomonadota bacterium]
MSQPDAYPPPQGHRPYFFDDPAIDQLHTALLAVTQELSVARERIDTLERLLEQSGHLQRAAIDAYRPDAVADAARTVQRETLVARVLKPFVDYRTSLFNRKRGTS